MGKEGGNPSPRPQKVVEPTEMPLWDNEEEEGATEEGVEAKGGEEDGASSTSRSGRVRWVPSVDADFKVSGGG